MIDSRQLELALRGDGNARHFLERLKELFNNEYLHRPPVQKRPGATRRPMIYALGVRGRELLDELDQVVRVGKRDWRNENKRLKLQTLDHEIAVTETVLALHFAALHRSWDFRWWRDPRYITDGVLPSRVAIASEHGRFNSLPLRPDAYAIITRDDHHQMHLFIEVDRGTEAQKRIVDKLLAYWHFITPAKRTPGQSWCTLFITTSAERAANMRDKAQQEVDPKRKGTHSILLTTLDRCRIDIDRPLDVFFEPIWWSTRVGYDNSRAFLLDACPKCHQLIDPSNEPYEIVNTDPRIVLAPASTPLDDFLPADAPVYAHTICPGHR